jgi:hypothetical protein
MLCPDESLDALGFGEASRRQPEVFGEQSSPDEILTSFVEVHA